MFAAAPACVVAPVPPLAMGTVFSEQFTLDPVVVQSTGAVPVTAVIVPVGTAPPSVIDVPLVLPITARCPTVAPLPGPVTALGADTVTVDPVCIVCTGFVPSTDVIPPLVGDAVQHGLGELVVV